MRDLIYAPEDPIRSSHAWRTWTTASRDGTEQRIATAENPRWSLGYRLLLTDEAEVARLRWLIAQGTGDTWRVPLWMDGHRITGVTAGPPGTVSGDFAASNIATADLVYLAPKNGTAGEFGTVASINSTTITLSAAIAGTYPAGSRVYPAIVGTVSEGQAMQRLAAEGIAEADVAIEMTGSRAIGGDSATLNEYAGLPVIDRRSVGDRFIEAHESGSQRIDYGGVVEVVSGWDVPRATYQRTFYLPDVAAEQWLRKLCGALRGQRDQAWAPTWRQDFTVVSAVATESTIVVADQPAGAIAAWFAAGGETRVQIEALDGTVTYREVAAVSAPSGGNVTLTLDDANPTVAASMRALSLLQLVRGGSDVVSVEWTARGSMGAVVLRTLGGEAADV